MLSTNENLAKLYYLRYILKKKKDDKIEVQKNILKIKVLIKAISIKLKMSKTILQK